MEGNANFIPLGAVGEKAYFDTGEKPELTGKTKEEKRDIGRRIRLAAKKEKKKIKSDAKKQRKQNAIMHRRATKNPEKYVKNKDRNAIRAIDDERTKIRLQAVRQAEALAAKHDMTGKMFNVGEVVIMPDGKVRSKEVLKRAEEAKKAREAGAQPQNGIAAPAIPAGINPARVALIQTDNNGVTINPKMSKRQQKKVIDSAPKPVPPRPILPEGISLPEGEENLIALWDITDQEIKSRLSSAKGRKKQAAKALRRQQKEQKKFNRALKVKRKEAANQGVLWDPVKAKKEILGEMSEEKDSDSDSSSSSGSEAEEATEKGNGTKESKKVKESESDAAEDKPKAKKSKKAKQSESDDTESGDAKEKKPKKQNNLPKLRKDLLKDDEIAKRVLKEQRRARKEQKRREALAVVKAKEEADLVKRRAEKEAKKKAIYEEKRRLKFQNEVDDAPEQGEPKKRKRSSEDQVESGDAEKVKKSSKKQKKAKAAEAAREDAATTSAAPDVEKWNADALSGDAARKDKFLRLLGAGKANGSTEENVKSKKPSKNGTVDISHVESELERQYDTGMKMKHDGQGKRRGIGA